jgi:hypothetical protein
MMNNYKGISNLVIEGNVDHYRALEETTMYYTLNDAHELIKQIGMKNFLESLYHEKVGRLLTVEEHEAMQVLHDNWDL